MNVSQGLSGGFVPTALRRRPNLSFSRGSNLSGRNHRASAQSSAETGIVTRLIGQQLLHLDQTCSVAPLLLPVQHQVPFAAALLIHRPSSSTASPLSVHRNIHAAAQQSSTQLVELLYVLSGSGYFTSSSGVSQRVAAGDSVLAVLGEVTFTAGASPPQPAAVSVSPAVEIPTANESRPGSSSQEQEPGWWNLVPWLQHHTHISNVLRKQHLNHNQQQQQPMYEQAVQQTRSYVQEQQQQLVMLQLLLPSELLTGELDHYHPGHFQAVAQQLPWAELLDTQTGSHIDQHSVCQLLSGALGVPQQQQQQQVEPQSQQQQVAATGALINNHSNGSSNESTSSKQHVAQSNSSSSSNGSTLPSLAQQKDHCVKRGLSEVDSFQLPAQTNRLALLFGPHASPAVCLSFGVEMFEPGHVTPLHTHSSAHELFFVLAGNGLGVHGPEGREKTPLSAGDVAVFPPGVLHGLDNPSDQHLYCLQMMLPNESFVEWVRSGQAAGALDVSALQQLAAAASCGAQ